jgi:excisionase family DNA binding protein
MRLPRLATSVLPRPSRAAGDVTERLLTARELADYVSLKPATVLDKWERGERPGFKFGRAVRFDLEEVLALGRREQIPGQPLRSVR